MDEIQQVRVAISHIKLWPQAYEMGAHDTNVCNAVTDTMEKLLAVYEAAGEYLGAETLDNQLRLNAAWNAVPDKLNHGENDE